MDEVLMSKEVRNWFCNLACDMAEHDAGAVKIAIESKNYVLTFEISMTVSKKE